MKIIYEDQSILVCEKPANLPVQSRRASQKDMVSMLKTYLRENQNVPGEPYLGLIHRLDQPVQGILVFAKTKAAAAALSTQIQSNSMKKEYLAVVCGKPVQKQGRLVDYLLKDGRTNTSGIVNPGIKGAKRAELDYRVIKESETMALCEITLQSGRHHQIRVQMTGAGMPLAGDIKYHQTAEKSQDGVALCAHRLTFQHPETGQQMTFACIPSGKNFKNFLK